MSILNRISYLDKLLFTKHLAVMIKAGISINEALRILYEQTNSSSFKLILKEIISDIENGQSLTKALTKHPHVFNNLFTSLVEIGEESGTLEASLKFLEKQLTKDYWLKKKIQGALIYPAMIISATLLVGGGVSYFVLPQLVDIFSALDVSLPFTTRMILVLASIIKYYGFYILIGIIGLISLSLYLIKMPLIKPMFHALILKIPVIGNLIKYSIISRFCRNFGVLIKSGVPISRALKISYNLVDNLRFRKELVLVSQELTKGNNIGKTLAGITNSAFPLLVSRMISTGEKTGKLEEVLLYLGKFYEDEVSSTSKNISTLIEPILLIFIGLAVGFLALSIIAPIYELTGSIR